MTVPAEQRDRLLRELRGGADLETAADSAGVPLGEIRSDGELLGECRNVFQLATGHMRSKMAAKALAGRSPTDACVLEREVERRDRVAREAFQAQSAADGDVLGGLDLTSLTDEQLELCEAALSGDIRRVQELVDHRVECGVQRMRAELMAEVAAHAAAQARPAVAEIMPPERPRRREERELKRAPPLEVLDVAEPVPRARALVEQRRAPPIGRSKVERDPGSPWGSEALEDYPL